MMPCFTSRHPELASGSISPHARSYRRKAKPRRQIMPVGVLALDKVDLPLPVPPLQLLFAQDGSLHRAELLEADEGTDAIFASEATDEAVAMLDKPLKEVAGHADIKRSPRLAGKDVDARIALSRHVLGRAALWTLKQVQGDNYAVKSIQFRHAELVSASIGRIGKERCM